MKSVIAITGQTGTGKTSLGIKKAHEVGGEIISADSRQLYKELDIVTGKDIGDSSFTSVDTFMDKTIGYYEVDGIKIWGYDLVTPDKQFSSHDYTEVALWIINNTIDSSSVPIVVGGTYLYLQNLLYGFQSTVAPDWDLRDTLEKKPVEELQHMLHEHAPHVFEAMNNSDKHNPRRLIRKIEIAQLDNLQESTDPSSEIKIQEFIGLHFASDETLRSTIETRVKERIKQGAFKEAKSLFLKGYTAADPGLQTIGYKEIFEHIEGDLELEEAVDQWILSEVQYAKRQWTFMKRNADITWHTIT